MINVLGELLALGVNRLSLANLAVLSKQSPTSSNPPKYARQLVEAELLEQIANGTEKLFALTQRGKQHVDPACFSNIYSLNELHQCWLEWLNKHYGAGHAQFLRFLIEAGDRGESLSKTDLALQAGYLLTSSGPSAKLRDFEALGLIQKNEPNAYRLSDLLQPAFLSEVAPH